MTLIAADSETKPDLENDGIKAIEMKNNDVEVMDCDKVVFVRTDSEDPDLEDTDFEDTELEDTEVEGTLFEDAEFDDVQFDDNELESSDFKEMDVRRAEIVLDDLLRTEIEHKPFNDVEFDPQGFQSDFEDAELYDLSYALQHGPPEFESNRFENDGEFETIEFEPAEASELSDASGVATHTNQDYSTMELGKCNETNAQPCPEVVNDVRIGGELETIDEALEPTDRESTFDMDIENANVSLVDTDTPMQVVEVNTESGATPQVDCEPPVDLKSEMENETTRFVDPEAPIELLELDTESDTTPFVDPEAPIQLDVEIAGEATSFVNPEAPIELEEVRIASRTAPFVDPETQMELEDVDLDSETSPFVGSGASMILEPPIAVESETASDSDEEFHDAQQQIHEESMSVEKRPSLKGKKEKAKGHVIWFVGSGACVVLMVLVVGATFLLRRDGEADTTMVPTESPSSAPVPPTATPTVSLSPTFTSNPTMTLAYNKLGQTLNGPTRSHFGQAVALSASGAIMAVGADGGGMEGAIGHVQVYRLAESNTWAPHGETVHPFNNVVQSRFGYSVAMSKRGDVLAVGAPFTVPAKHPSHGRIHVYVDGPAWKKIAEITNNIHLGVSFDMSEDGSVIVAGIPSLASSPTPNFGKALFYRLDREREIVEATGSILGRFPSDNFGSSMSLSFDGEVVAIGAAGYEDGDYNFGYVRIMKYDGSNYETLGSEIYGEAGFGTSVDLSSDGRIVAIGAVKSMSSNGLVQVFAYNGTHWNQRGGDLAGFESGRFGASVSLSSNGNVLAVGAPGIPFAGAHGNVHVFQYSENSWSLVDEFVGDHDDGRFGNAVAVSDDGAIVTVGAKRSRGNAGEVRTYGPL